VITKILRNVNIKITKSADVRHFKKNKNIVFCGSLFFSLYNFAIILWH